MVCVCVLLAIVYNWMCIYTNEWRKKEGIWKGMRKEEEEKSAEKRERERKKSEWEMDKFESISSKQTNNINIVSPLHESSWSITQNLSEIIIWYIECLEWK